MIIYVFLFCSFLLGLVFLFRIFVYFFSVYTSRKSNQYSESFLKRIFPTSFISFTILLLFLTSVAYYFKGRSDLIQTQLTQKKLETKFSNFINENLKNENEQEVYILFKKLKKTLLERPRDLKGFRLLVTTSISLKEYQTARIAQETVMQLSNPNVTVEDYILYLDLALLAAGGRVSLEASKVLKDAVVLYPQNEALIFFKALEHIEKREYQKAVKLFYFLKENDNLDTKKLELLKQKLSRLINP